MKRNILINIKKVFLLVLPLMLVSCRTKKNEHAHNYIKAVTAPTCFEQGYTTYTCTICNDSYKADYTNPIGHSYSTEWSKDNSYHWHQATCEHTNEIKDKESHDFVDTGVIVVIATSTIEGEKEQKCSVCGKIRIVKTGYIGHEHTFDNDSWTHNETYHWHPATCEHTTETSGKAEHDFNVIVTAPTCTERGYTTHTCKVCGYSFVDNYIDPTGHSYSLDWSHDDTYHWHPATCDHTTETSGKVEHDFDDGVVILKPTKSETGIIRYTCLTCGFYKDEIIPKIPLDDVGDWDPIK